MAHFPTGSSSWMIHSEDVWTLIIRGWQYGNNTQVDCGISFFSDHSLYTLEMMMHENPSRSGIYEILIPPHVAPTTMPCS